MVDVVTRNYGYSASRAVGHLAAAQHDGQSAVEHTLVVPPGGPPADEQSAPNGTTQAPPGGQD
jgi:hypothetical protein